MPNINIGKHKRLNKVYGFGEYTEGEYSSRIEGKKTTEYNAWTAMLQRCYDEKLHKKHPSYRECYVCDEWLNFQNFAGWFRKNYIDGYQLDKDLLVKGNKIYSPEACCFIPQEINLLLIKPLDRKSIYSTGVYKFRDKFIVHLRRRGKQYHIGSYSTIENAKIAYDSAKTTYIHDIAKEYRMNIGERIYNILINYNTHNN